MAQNYIQINGTIIGINPTKPVAYTRDILDIDSSTKLSDVVNYIYTNVKPHIVLTQEEYDDLDNPDYNSFYFTYEDSSSNI